MQEVDERYLFVDTEHDKAIKIFENTIEAKFIKREAIDDKWLSDYLTMYNLTPDHFCGYFVEGVEKPYMITDKTVDNLFVNEELANKYLKRMGRNPNPFRGWVECE